MVANSPHHRACTILKSAVLFSARDETSELGQGIDMTVLIFLDAYGNGRVVVKQAHHRHRWHDQFTALNVDF